MLRAIALAVALAVLAPGVARGSPSWSWPVRGRVVGAFLVTAGDPFAPGQRRGIAIAAAPGTTVHAACAGRVAFAGSVGRSGPTLSVRCGALQATYQGLAAIAARPGATVVAGEPVATLGERGVLRLGARVGPGDYVDPGSLLRAGRRPPSLLGRAPRGSRPRRLPGPVRVAAPRRFSLSRRPSVRPRSAPLAAWLGLAAFAAAVPVGALRRRVRPRPAGRRTWEVGQLRR